MRSTNIVIRRALSVPRILVTGTLFLLGSLLGCSRTPTPQKATGWSPRGAAEYLDIREAQWATWPGAARDHGTFCISCHTALPYALARPALKRVLSETNVSSQEKRLLKDVVTRVRLGDEADPYYSDKDTGLYKSSESRGTEAVLNALILATHDAQQGRLSPDAQAAFHQMWALQEKSGKMQGSWPWLAFGHEEPWEADDSRYYGACLAAVAVGRAPSDYRNDPKVQQRVGLLRSYIGREYSQESLINRVSLLWASAEMPGLIASERQKAIVDEVLKKQQSDGGWQLAPLAWKWRGWTFASFGRSWIRSDGSLAKRESDGYATALIAFVLPRAGVPRDNPQLQKAISWLASNQSDEGYWPSYSINKRRNPSSNSGRFMSDAATAYAVLALTEDRPDNRLTATKQAPNPSSNQLSY